MYILHGYKTYVVYAHNTWLENQQLNHK